MWSQWVVEPISLLREGQGGWWGQAGEVEGHAGVKTLCRRSGKVGVWWGQIGNVVVDEGVKMLPRGCRRPVL